MCGFILLRSIRCHGQNRYRSLQISEVVGEWLFWLAVFCFDWQLKEAAELTVFIAVPATRFWYLSVQILAG